MQRWRLLRSSAPHAPTPQPPARPQTAGRRAAARLWSSWASRHQTRTLGAPRPACLAPLLLPLSRRFALPAARRAVAAASSAAHLTISRPPPPLPRCLPAAPRSSSCLPTAWRTGCCPRWRGSLACTRRRWVGGRLARAGGRMRAWWVGPRARRYTLAWPTLVCDSPAELCSPPRRRARLRATWRRCRRRASGSWMTASARRTRVRGPACPWPAPGLALASPEQGWRGAACCHLRRLTPTNASGTRAPWPAERALCNRCATCLEHLHFNCGRCGSDLCPACAREARRGARQRGKLAARAGATSGCWLNVLGGPYPLHGERPASTTRG